MDVFAQLQEARDVVRGARFGQDLGQAPQGVRDVADHLVLREVHLFDAGWVKADVKTTSRGPLGAHQEWRLLDDIVTDRQNQIGFGDRVVNVVAFGERRRTEVQIRIAVDRALPHLRVEERDARTAHERRELRHQVAAVGGGADHDQGPLRRR